MTDVTRYDDNFVYLRWNDGHEGKYPLNYEAAFNLPDKIYKDRLCKRENQTMQFWNENNQEIDHEFDYNHVKSSESVLKEVLLQLCKHGIVRIKNSKPNVAELFNLISELKIGPKHSTIYGEDAPFQVITQEQGAEDNVAYKRMALPLHTDLSYYKQPPAVFLFQCIESTAEGGESFYVDSFAVLDMFRKKHPEEFKVLVDTKVVWRNHQKQWYVCSEIPVVQLSENGDFYCVRDFKI